MSTIGYLLLLFIVGALQDVICTYYLRCVKEDKIKMATLLSVVITITGFCVWDAIIHSMSGIQGISAYSLGGGAGTYMALKGGNRVKN